jgi:hypothetical protein
MKRERWWLRLYPKRFRERFGEEMARLVEDDRRRLLGRSGLVFDVAGAAVGEHVREWRRRTVERKTIVALLLLAIPVLFLGIVALQELAGVDGPMQVLYPEGVGSVRRAVTDVVIVGSPVVALAVAATTMLRFRWHPNASSLASISVARVAWVHYAIVIAAGMIVAIFGAYSLAENWECIFGNAKVC